MNRIVVRQPVYLAAAIDSTLLLVVSCHPEVLSQTLIPPDTYAFEQGGVLWSPVQQLITTPSVDGEFHRTYERQPLF